MNHTLQRLARAWEMTSELHELAAGAEATRMGVIERVVGRRLPEPASQLYRLTNGAALFNGNIRLLPLEGDELSVANASATYRSWSWSIPDELLLIGDNGAGDPFGLWLPEAPAEDGMVVEVGRMFDGGSFAVAATSLDRYLEVRTAYYLLLIDAPAQVLDCLEIPRELHTAGGEEPDYGRLLDWADPGRPPSAADPYDAGLDAAGLRSVLASPCLPRPAGPPS